MFKYAVKQIRVYSLGYVGTIITLITTAILGMVSCELLGSSVIDLINNGSTDSTTRAISMFGSVCGFLIFLGISSLVMASNYSIKRRWKSFSNLRMLGNTYKDIRRMILIETLILSLIALVIGIPIGIEVSYPILDKFKDVTGISNSIHVGWNYILILITVGVLIFITISTVWFISKKLRKITIDQVKDINNLESKFSIIFKVIFGLLLILTPIVVFNLVNLEGGFGQIFMTIGLFAPVVGFAFAGKYIYRFILFLLKKLFPNGSKISYFLASLNNSLSKIINITTSIAFIVVFQGILVTSTKTLAISKNFVTSKLYSGLNTYQIDDISDLDSISTSDVSIIYNLDAMSVHKIKKEDRVWENVSLEMIDGKMPYNLDSGVDGMVLKNNEAVITTDYPETKIGAIIPLKFNGVEHDFIVKNIVASPLRKAQFTSIYIGYNQTLLNNLKASDVIIASKNKLSNSLLKEYNPLTHTEKSSNAADAVTDLIQWMVIIFSIINILNFILLFVYDKRKENKLKNILGATSRIVNTSLVFQAGIVATIGVLVGLYSTLTFTVPYVNANPGNLSIIASPVTFSIICFSIIMGTMIFSCFISKITTRK